LGGFDYFSWPNGGWAWLAAVGVDDLGSESGRSSAEHLILFAVWGASRGIDAGCNRSSEQLD
jgi:hypothetical protein